jgi:hypothetical protein
MELLTGWFQGRIGGDKLVVDKLEVDLGAVMVVGVEAAEGRLAAEDKHTGVQY